MRRQVRGTMEAKCPVCGTARLSDMTKCECGFCFTEKPRATGVPREKEDEGPNQDAALLAISPWAVLLFGSKNGSNTVARVIYVAAAVVLVLGLGLGVLA